MSSTPLRTVLVILALTPFAGARGGGDLLLRDVRVVDVERAAVREGQSVLVRAGRIESVGSTGEVRAPDGATVVDGDGRYLMPGLFDTHVHLDPAGREEDLVLYLAAGVTTVRSMHGSPGHLDMRARVASGDVLAPRILTTGPTTSRERVNTPEKADALVRAQAAAGYDAVKMYGDGNDTMTRATYDRLLETAREVGIPVVGHAPRNMPFAVVLEGRQSSIDHMEEVTYTAESLLVELRPFIELQFGRRQRDDPVFPDEVPDFGARLAPAVGELAREVRAAGLVVTPTLSTFAAIQAMTDASFFERLERAELTYRHPLDRREWTPERARFRNGGWKPKLAYMASYLRRNLELQMALTGAFHEAGVPILTGTDAPFDLVVQGFSLHDELALLIECGLTPVEALACATSAPARELTGGDAGAIEAGRRADLVLVDGNPLEDVAHARNVAGVVAAGRWLPRAELDRQLDAIADHYRAIAPVVERIATAFEGERYDDALAAHAELPRADPRTAIWVRERILGTATALMDGGDTEGARDLLALALDSLADSAAVWSLLGEVHRRRYEHEEAEYCLRHALELDPEDAEARERLDALPPR